MSSDIELTNGVQTLFSIQQKTRNQTEWVRFRQFKTRRCKLIVLSEQKVLLRTTIWNLLHTLRLIRSSVGLIHSMTCYNQCGCSNRDRRCLGQQGFKLHIVKTIGGSTDLGSTGEVLIPQYPFLEPPFLEKWGSKSPDGLGGVSSRHGKPGRIEQEIDHMCIKSTGSRAK